MAPRDGASSESDAEMLEGDSDVEYNERNDGNQGKGKGKEKEKKGKSKGKDVSVSLLFLWEQCETEVFMGGIGWICVGGKLYEVLGPGSRG